MADASAVSGSPFLAILRFAHLGDPRGQVDVFALVTARTSALRPKEPDEATQVILWKVMRSPERALLLLSRLAQQNARLAEILAQLEPDRMPVLDASIVGACDKQLSGYVSQMIRNGEKDRARHQRFTDPLPDDDVLRASTGQLDNQGEVLKLGSMALATAVQDETRPEWLDDTLEEIQTLARGERTMDELTAACVANDGELAAVPPELARVRARNRIQQRHKRAREHLLVCIRRMVAYGKLAPDEGREAERWLSLLKRRQIRGPGASRKKKHDE